MMKFYAKDDALSREDMGGIEITEREFYDAIDAKVSGREAYVHEGSLLIHSEEKRTVYHEKTGSPKKIAENAPLPQDHVEIFVEPEKTPGQLAILEHQWVSRELYNVDRQVMIHISEDRRAIGALDDWKVYARQLRDYTSMENGVVTINTEKPVRPS